MNHLRMWKLFLLTLFLVNCGILYGQPQPAVDFLHGQIDLKIYPKKKTIEGKVGYLLITNQKTNEISIDARNMRIEQVRLDGRNVKYSYNDTLLILKKKLKTDREYRVEISYSCSPKQAVYFLGWNDSIPGNEQIWTQGQGKYSSHWVPSFDDMNEKVEFDISLTVDDAYEVIANGKLKDVQQKDGLKTWNWDMIQPMSSYLLAFAVGKYKVSELYSSSGVRLSNYIYPKDSLLLEPTYRYSIEIFDFLENEIGVPYPWQNYKQLPVRDFLYAGMENTGTTIFSDSFLIDSTAFTDTNYVNVNAHELAHQWFGNAVTEVDASNHWLHEGFATYFATLAEKEHFGNDYYYWLLFDKAKALEELSRDGAGESLLDPKAGSITFYDKGALAIYMLEEQIGAAAFKQALRTFFSTYQFKNTTVSQLIDIMEKTSLQDLSSFKKKWLQDTLFQFEEVLLSLRKNCLSIDSFLKLQRELMTSSQPNELILKRYWEGTPSSEFRSRLISLYHKSLSDDFLKKAFDSNDLKVRQALALLPGSVSESLIEEYESLLTDQSYTTIENTLYRLWIYNPAKRANYLDRTKNIIGFSDKNVRQLWLLLAILSKDYGTADEKIDYQKELFDYTASYHPMQVRRLAFNLIGEVFPFSDQNLKDLINAAIHPAWQFRKFARGLVDKLLNDTEQKQRLSSILKSLKGEEYQYLTLKLKQK